MRCVCRVLLLTVDRPANMICKKVGPRFWLVFLTTSFGLVTTCIAFITSFGGLIAVRVLLGACEAGILPGIMYTLSTFYRRHELATRMGYLSAVVSLSGAFGGLLATGFSRIPGIGMLHTWRYIYLFEGIITILVGASVLMLPNSPDTASFLTEEERGHSRNRLIGEAKALPYEKINKVTFRRAILHIPTQTVAIGLICSLCCMGSLAIFSVSPLHLWNL
jgi:MFS family permease